MKRVKEILIFSAFFVFVPQWYACNESTDQSSASAISAPSVEVPVFNPDRAYQYLKTQVEFGPRVPGTKAQEECAAWMESELRKSADTVYVQRVSVTQPGSNKTYPAINIIASFSPQLEDRVLLLAHWDSRPWADQDPNYPTKSIDAADDGASGVAVLLEIASLLKLQKPSVGIDILLVDAEDVGKSEWGDESWCLGTQHWAANPHVPNYRAMFGIGLDMVGSKGARFPLEGNSQTYAGSIQREIWETAKQIGYANYFVFEQAPAITDDHLVVNKVLKIPCVDIINLKPNGGFGDHWHTLNDNIEIIDPSTLKAVGQTVLQVIYNQ
jgi:hypothetical protein